jgi:hypothetical protein
MANVYVYVANHHSTGGLIDPPSMYIVGLGGDEIPNPFVTRLVFFDNVVRTGIDQSWHECLLICQSVSFSLCRIAGFRWLFVGQLTYRHLPDVLEHRDELRAVLRHSAFWKGDVVLGQRHG